MSRDGERLVYFPAVERESELIDLVSRAAWFLTFSGLKTIYVPIADRRLATTKWRVAPGMDPAIAERFDALREQIEFVPASREADLARPLRNASIVLLWKEIAGPRWARMKSLKPWLAKKKVWRVDPHSVRQEGSFYIETSFRKAAERKLVAAQSFERFTALADRIGRRERAYVLATGPSVAGYDEFDYTDAVSVVCNSVILDEPLMTTVNPELLVFADPIFHFGPSQYAASFRESLRSAASRFDFTICIPAKYHAVFTAAVPELAERTIAIPFQKQRDFNFDLKTDFELKTTANVLTFVMLPLAATFADRIGILGCDGRPMNENTYFWSHNRTTQINDKMANIRQVHPGFFDIDYDDYYTEHCETLAEQLHAGEQEDLRFESLGFSHIPALATRSRPTAGGLGEGAPETVREPALPAAPPLPVRRATSGRLHEALQSDQVPIAQRGTGQADHWPRLLVIDPTGVHDRNATGRLKQSLLDGWPDERFLQIASPAGDGREAIIRSLDGPSAETTGGPTTKHVSTSRLHDEIAAFRPEVIYYRPLIDSHPKLHEKAMEILDRHPVALVTHVMDDWPDRLHSREPERAGEVDAALREVLGRSSTVLSICDKMSETFKARYGASFEAIANGVDVDTFRRASAEGAAARAVRGDIVFRYCGAIAKDMNFNSVVEVARSIDVLADELPIRFEVYTMPAWRTRFGAAIAGLKSVSLHETVADSEYPLLLAGADVLVLAYNFDPGSLRYIKLSMPNKLPEYLGAGAALLAVGPPEAAGIDVVRSNSLGYCVLQPDPGEITSALRALATDPALRERLGGHAQAWAFANSALSSKRQRFHQILKEAAKETSPMQLPVSFPREAGASVDETHAIAKLLDARGPRHVLIDVGAHHGSALAPFARAGWTVLAFEPDATNRQQLSKRFRGSKNVKIDPRAISDQPADEVAFFSSEESTGISALHPFRESHEQSDTVAVTTVEEVIEQNDLSRVDFLKIDVEGFDWNVLKGVPWDRLQPEVVETEFEDAKTLRLGHTYREVADFLVEHGYTVYLSEWHPIIRYGIPHQWRQLIRYPTPLASESAWGNILAFRHDPGIQALREAFSEVLKVEDASALEKHAEIPRPRQEARAERDPAVADAISTSGWRRIPLVVPIGRFVKWVGQKMRAYPILSAATTLALVTLVAAAMANAGDQANVLWVATLVLPVLAALILLAGYVRYRLKRVRYDLQLQQDRAKVRLDRIDIRQERVRERLTLAEVRQENVRERLAQEKLHDEELHERLDQHASAHDSLSRQVSSLASDSKAIGDRLRKLQSERQEADAGWAELSDRIKELESEQERTAAGLSSKLDDLAGSMDALDSLSEAVGAFRRDGVSRIAQLEESQAATKDAFDTKVSALESKLAAPQEQSKSHEQLRERISKLEERSQALTRKTRSQFGELSGSQSATAESIARLEKDLSGALKAISRQAAQAALRYPAANSAAWTPVHRGPVEAAATREAVLPTRFKGGEGVQAVTQPMALSVDGAGGSRSVSVNSLEELPNDGIHAARWSVDGIAGEIGLVVALKPRGRRFVELSLENSGPLVAARFDIDEAAFLGGAGSDDARVAVQVADGEWRLCSLRLSMPERHGDAELRLSLSDSPDFKLAYAGEAGRGVLVSDPVAVNL